MATTDHGHQIVFGIRENRVQFSQQMLQVFFVGLTIGLQRNVLPALADKEFGLVSGSYTSLSAFIISFGLVKATMNFVSGRLSEKVGRRPVLIWGWIVALPIPFIYLYAPSWGWIIAANVLMGINQGFAWSMTVTSKFDIVRPDQRGLATGFNEFAGYGGVALSGLLIGYFATDFEPRMSLFSFGLAINLIALATAWLFFRETLAWAQAESNAVDARAAGTGQLRAFADLPGKLSTGEVFSLVSFRHRTFSALCQAGCFEKFVDTLVWAFFPVYLFAKGLSLIEIGWVTGVYGFVWGASQLVTGPLSDAVGRKWPIVIGMWVCAAGVMMAMVFESMTGWIVSAAITGIGMALLYPTLIAAIGDISHPNWRGSSLGVYRFWRDLGYALGAVLLGVIADSTNFIEAAYWTAAITVFLSGLWVAIAMEETLNPGDRRR